MATLPDKNGDLGQRRYSSSHSSPSYAKLIFNLIVYTADDVILAIRHGVDGVIVSNHGGRQLDGVPATLDALRECAAAGAGRIQIGIDGGIRRGTDIFKALALGATHCFAGRVPIWGLAVRCIPL